MHIAGGAENRFVLDRPMAAAAAPMGLAGHGAAGLSSLLHEGLARAKDLASKLDIAVDRTEISSRESTVLTRPSQPTCSRWIRKAYWVC